MADAGLYCMSKKELSKLLSRSELDLGWLQEMGEKTTGASNKHYYEQYKKELNYQEDIKIALRKFK